MSLNGKTLTDELLELTELQKTLGNKRHTATLGILSQLVEELTAAREEASSIPGYDQSLGAVLDKAIGGIAEAISKLNVTPKIDLSPVASAITSNTKEVTSAIKGLNDQNNQLIKAISNIQLKVEGGGNVEALISQLSKMINNQSQVIERMSVKHADYSNELRLVAKAIESRPNEWEFEVLRDQNRITRIIAKAV